MHRYNCPTARPKYRYNCTAHHHYNCNGNSTIRTQGCIVLVILIRLHLTGTGTRVLEYPGTRTGISGSWRTVSVINLRNTGTGMPYRVEVQTVPGCLAYNCMDTAPTRYLQLHTTIVQFVPGYRYCAPRYNCTGSILEAGDTMYIGTGFVGYPVLVPLYLHRYHGGTACNLTSNTVV
jgi:hypothetical protein